MSNQVQCPNCGGYRVATETKVIDVERGTTIDFGGAFWFFLVMGIVGVVGGTSGVIDVVFYGKSLEYSGVQLCILLPTGLLFTIPLIAMIVRYHKNPMAERYYHTCWLCGYKWNRGSGEPLPKVTLRPDLITKGEQRLEEARQAEIAHHAAQDILNRKP